MSHSKYDRRLVASKENDGSEVNYLLSKWDISRKDLEAIMLEITGTGKPARSRERIEAVLEDRQYKLRVKQTK